MSLQNWFDGLFHRAYASPAGLAVRGVIAGTLSPNSPAEADALVQNALQAVGLRMSPADAAAEAALPLDQRMARIAARSGLAATSELGGFELPPLAKGIPASARTILDNPLVQLPTAEGVPGRNLSIQVHGEAPGLHKVRSFNLGDQAVGEAPLHDPAAWKPVPGVQQNLGPLGDLPIQNSKQALSNELGGRKGYTPTGSTKPPGRVPKPGGGSGSPETRAVIGQHSWDTIHPDIRSHLLTQHGAEPGYAAEFNQRLIQQLHDLPPTQVQSALGKLVQLQLYNPGTVSMISDDAWRYISHWHNTKSPPPGGFGPIGGSTAPLSPKPPSGEPSSFGMNWDAAKAQPSDKPPLPPIKSGFRAEDHPNAWKGESTFHPSSPQRSYPHVFFYNQWNNAQEMLRSGPSPYWEQVGSEALNELNARGLDPRWVSPELESYNNGQGGWIKVSKSPYSKLVQTLNADAANKERGTPWKHPTRNGWQYMQLPNGDFVTRKAF